MIQGNKSFIDFHTHILPKMDDGPKDVVESISMLKEAKNKGIDHIIFTPHFYPDYEYPDVFLNRRAESFLCLKKSLENLDEVPTFSLGTEVAYFKGIGTSSSIKDLSIENSNFVLIEMPYFTKWDDELISDLLNLKHRQGLDIVLAHVNRFIKNGFKKYSEELRNNGVLFQWNGEAFLQENKKESLKYFEKGYVDILGSDTHSLKARPQNLDQTKSILLNENPSLFERVIEISNSIL